jgi:hypothetical protein
MNSRLTADEQSVNQMSQRGHKGTAIPHIILQTKIT